MKIEDLENYCFSWKLGGYYPEYNYKMEVEITDEDELTLYGMGGTNVEWTDREGRHPWYDLTLEFSLKTGEYEMSMDLGSKDGRIQEYEERKGTFDLNSSPEDLKEFFMETMDDLKYEVEERA